MKYKTKDIKLTVDDFHVKNHRQIVADFLKIKKESILNVSVFKKSVDARRKNNVHYVVSFVFETKLNLDKNKNVLPMPVQTDFFDDIKQKETNKKVLVVGSGSAGLFCALYLAKSGLKPILIEQGKCVKKRQQDIDKLWLDGVLNEESNVQFGLGGAGTFSDGKLTTSAHNQYVYTVFSQLVKYGAPSEILTEAMPHVGTDNLKTVVTNIAEEIEKFGGNVLFETKLTDFRQDGEKTVATIKNNQTTSELEVDFIVLAIGHSARDTFSLLNEKGMDISQKAFSVGVRIEHDREMINEARYGKNYDKRLPVATYKLATHLSNGRSVYTFCMCPGGQVVLSCSEKESIVTNGMSFFARNKQNSNSALLVNVLPSDFGSSHPLAGVEFQRKIERDAYELTGSFSAPCQQTTDFLKGKKSTEYGDVLPSIMPKPTPANLADCLPKFVFEALKQALPQFGKSIEGFDKTGIITGVETRSSSPVKLNRNENFATNLQNIFVCGEGSGYAGGIVTAAVDGLKCAIKLTEII